MNCIHLLASLFFVVLLSSRTFAQSTTSAVATTNSTTPTPSTSTPTNTTTASPKTSSTAKPTTTPTTTPTTVTTTAAPKEPRNNYTVTEDNVACIQMMAKIDFSIKYNKKKVGNTTMKVPVPGKFSTEGSCGNSTQTLKIKFYSGWELDYTFQKDSSTNYHVSNIMLKYVLDDNFPDAVDKDAVKNVTFNTKKDYMKANKDGYVCSSKLEKESGDVTINTEDLKYKAFNTKDTIDLKTTGLECSADEDTNSIVPIAVGAALAGLVVIVLIAYLIGRKRTRKTGYESV